jgi:hypothetical protein
LSSVPARKMVVGARRRTSGPTTVGWIAPSDLDLAEWIAAGRRLGAMVRCSQWWLGDWIRYGNSKFGERYTRASAVTGYDVQSLMNMVYVASRFEFSRRRENLSWSHHETLAALDQEEQNVWLERAVADRLSVADLRLELRTARRGHDARTAEVEARAEAAKVMVCPHCGGTLPINRILELPR